jgi:hypothetical protein
VVDISKYVAEFETPLNALDPTSDVSGFNVSKYVTDFESGSPVSDTVGTGTTPEADTDQKFTMEGLDRNKDWLKNAKVIFKHEQGEDFRGSNQELGYWLRNRHSKFANDLTNLGLTAMDTDNMSDEVKQSWVDSLDMWDNTDPTVGSFFNALYQVGTDPTTVAAALATFGMGGVVKMFGQKGATLAAKFAFKDQLKKSLIKRKVSEEVAEKVAHKKGAVAAVDESILKASRKEAAKNLAINRAAVGYPVGVAEMGAYDLAQQSFDIDVDRWEGVTETDYGQTAIMSLIGGIPYAVLGAGGLPVEKLTRRKAIRENKVLKDLEEEAAIPRSDTLDVTVGRNAGEAEVKKIARDAQRDLNEDGDLFIEIGEGTQGGPSGMIPNATGRNMSGETLKNTNRVLSEEGFTSLEKVGPGIYKARKIKHLPRVSPEAPAEPRTRLQKILGTVKRGIYANPLKGVTDEATEKAAIARRRLDAERTRLERAIATRFKRFTNAIKDDYSVKNLKSISEEEFKRFNRAYAGDMEALTGLEKEGKLKVLKELKAMRTDTAELQDQLLKSGVIKKGSDLDIKIRANLMGEGELYVTRSYEVFDNPNWRNTVSDKVKEEASDFFIGQAEIANPAFARVLSKSRAEGIDSLTASEKQLYDSYMGQNGSINFNINKILDVNGEEALFEIFDNAALGKAPFKILSKREDIPKAIRALMGEYEDPFTNYSRTMMRLGQTVEQGNYEKEIADLVNAGLIEGAVAPTITKGVGREMVELQSKLPTRGSINDPFAREVSEEGIQSPLTGMYAHKEIADAILNGNEISWKIPKALQGYLALQGHTRAAKTVWSPTAIARNFLGAAWMSIGAGYMRPSALKEIRKIAKGLSTMSDEALNAEIEKGIALGYLQSGTDIGSFRAALKDAGDESFWDLTNSAYKTKKGLTSRAKQLNTKAVKFYQSMDDMWKQFAFMNEKATYRQVLVDQGLDPEQIVRKFRTGDGIEVNVTRLDEYASNQVSKHMQNYGGVPQFVRAMRLLPAADFLAFTTEMLRTQKNIIKTALGDMREGRKLMALKQPATEMVQDADGNMVERVIEGQLKGQAQAKAGERRLGSVIAAQSAAPALALASSMAWGLEDKAVDENGKELPFTIKEGFEAFDQPWEKGSTFLYLGAPKNGKVRRLNLSYLNPWAQLMDPIRAGMRALSSGADPDLAVDDAIVESVWRPLKETFGPSMLAESIANIAFNRDNFGREIFAEGDSAGQNFRSGVETMYKAFEPGLFKSMGDIAGAYNLPGQEFGVTRSGRKVYAGDQWMGLLGIKPQEIDIKDTLGFKVNDIKRDMGASGKTFQRAYRQRTPITATELSDAYAEGLAKEYEKAREMHLLLTKAMSLGLSKKQIINAVSDDGLFSNRLDKSLLLNLMDRGVFVPAPPKMNEVYKWGLSTKKRTGSMPPIREAQRDIFDIYRSYVGSETGVR